MNSVFGSEGRFRTEAGYLDGLGALLNLVTLVEPVVLVLDEADGLAGDGDAALRVTSSLVSLWEACRRVNIVVSVNDDVWGSTFSPGLPAGLRDRLDDVVVRLHSLNLEEANRLISARAGDESEKVISKLDLLSGDLYPRGVLKAAREVWSRRDDPEFTVARPQFRPFSEPAFSESPAPVERPPYPPHPVKRVELPKFFDVQRLPSVPPVAGFHQPLSAGVPPSPFPVTPFSEKELDPKTPPPLPQGEDGESPFDSAAASQSGEAGKQNSSTSFFDPAVAIEAMEANEVQKPEPFRPASDQGEGSKKRGAVPGGAVHPSPFEIVSPPPRARQEESPRGDADAIDELLRQFREHRDS